MLHYLYVILRINSDTETSRKEYKFPTHQLILLTIFRVLVVSSIRLGYKQTHYIVGIGHKLIKSEIK